MSWLSLAIIIGKKLYHELRILDVINHFMKMILPYFGFFVLAISASGQQRVSFDTDKQPYFLVDTFTADFKCLVISPEKIEAVNILKDSNAVAMYGEKAKFGAVIMKTKPNTILLRVGDILTKYNVSKSDQTLRICINKTLVSRPDLILIEASEILGVEITTERYWLNAEEANSDEKFINIKTSRTDKNGQ